MLAAQGESATPGTRRSTDILSTGTCGQRFGARQRIRCSRNAEGAAAAAAAGGADRRAGRRRVDSALRASLLAGARPRVADRGDHAGLRGQSRTAQTIILWAATPFLTAAYVRAIVLASPEPAERDALVRRSRWASSCSCPCRRSCGCYVLPALAWLALFGLAVPAAAHERLGFRDALARGRRLAAADYVHALGSLCALAIVYFVTRAMLGCSCYGQADAGAHRRVHRRARHLAAPLPRRRRCSTSTRPPAS